MKSFVKVLLVLVLPLILGCSLLGRALAPAATLPMPPTDTVTQPAAPLVTATIEASATLSPSETPEITDTPQPSNPQLPSFYNNLSNISQYFNPAGQPVNKWQTVPIMPQATAGQDWSNGVYSYRANATLNQAVAYYSKFNPSGGYSMPPATGYAGTGADATHSATFLYSNMIIYITSFDNDTAHVIVVISK